MRTTSRDGPKQLVVPARSVRLWLADLRSMRVEYATWRRQFPQGGFARLQRAQVPVEAGAAAVRVFEPSIVPGLLQSPDYTRHVFRGLAQLPGRGRDIDEGVHARVRRQEILYQPGKDFRFLVTEAAMQYLICPRPVLRTQLERLAVMSALPNGRPGRDPDGRGTATHVLARLLDLRDAVGARFDVVPSYVRLVT